MLAKRNNPNVLLIGDPGVGKTAPEGLAKRIVDGNVSEYSKDSKVYNLDIGLVAGTKYRGEFEERPKEIIALNKWHNYLIDEAHPNERCWRRR